LLVWDRARRRAVTRANLDKIQENQTLAEVEKIMGGKART